MRIALAQINPTVGDIGGNIARIIDFTARARTAGAALVLFPELSVVGYPPKDLLLKPVLIQENLSALKEIARQSAGVDVLVGYVEPNPQSIGRPLFNAAALLRDGVIHSRYFKTLLPTYDVFDESRYFESRPAEHGNQIFSAGGLKFGVSICEDLWNDDRLIPRRLYHQDPLAELHAAGAQVVLNISASPFTSGKPEFRDELFSSQARRFAKPLLMVNQVGGNDELVFDGNSLAFDGNGRLIGRARDFEEDLLIIEMDDQLNRRSADAIGGFTTPAQGAEAIYKALTLGLRDYVDKCQFKSVVLGLSGGIDSALSAALAAAALGPDRVVGVAMPSRFSSEHSLRDAKQLAKNLGIQFHVVPIDSAHQSFEKMLSPAFNAPAGLGDDLTEQNIQARIRGVTLMAFSNRYNHLLLTTGNKSELAVGYCTLYGDMCGGLAVISDVPKTMVWQMAKWINHHAGRELIPRSSIDKIPSAELRPNQSDQDSLPPYDLLDAIIHRYVEEEKSVGEIIAEGLDEQTVRRVIKLIDRSEYKRRQAAPGLKVTSRAFGFGRRMPIAQNYTPR